MTKQRVLTIILTMLAALCISLLIFTLACCRIGHRSRSIPSNGTVFVGRGLLSDRESKVIIYDNAAYIGRGRESLFTRFALSFDSNYGVYMLIPMNSFAGRIYPQAVIFRRCGAMHLVEGSTSDDFRGPSVRLHGFRWGISRFGRLSGVEIDRLDMPTNLEISENILKFDSPHRRVILEQSGFEQRFMGSYINLEHWRFASAGEFDFRVRSHGGYPVFCNSGTLKRFTVSSKLSTSYASLTVAEGQPAEFANFRIEDNILRWDYMPKTSYSTCLRYGAWFSGPAMWFMGLETGKHTFTITAHGRQQTIDGVITIPQSSTVTLQIKKCHDGTISFVQVVS